MATVFSSETLVLMYQTARGHKPADRNMCGACMPKLSEGINST
jgi:hypothetical protein